MTFRIELKTNRGRVEFGRTVYEPTGDIGNALIYFFDLANNKGIKTSQLHLDVYKI